MRFPRPLMTLSRFAYRKRIQWMVDVDYADKLGPKEKAWLAKFLNEYYNNNVKKNDPVAIHNTKKLRSKCYSAENQRNRDLMNVGHREYPTENQQ